MGREKAFVSNSCRSRRQDGPSPEGMEARLGVKEVEMAWILKCRVGGEEKFPKGSGDMDTDVWSHLASV